MLRHPSEWKDEALFWSQALGRLRSILDRIEAGYDEHERIAGKHGQSQSVKDIEDRQESTRHGGRAD
jgi:hypothetical protein